jgi:hypothetical protein
VKNVIALRYGDLLNVLRTRLAFDEAVVDVRKHPDNSEGCAVGRGRKKVIEEMAGSNGLKYLKEKRRSVFTSIASAREKNTSAGR